MHHESPFQPSPAELKRAQRDVSRLVRSSGSTFYWPMRLLPRHQQEALFAVYAFCRRVDDVADAPDSLPANETLTFWREEIARLYAGVRPQHVIGLALWPAIRRHRLSRQHFLDVIAGCEMDTGTPIHGPDWATLERYCYRVASAVGLLTIEILGYTQPQSRDYAVALGKAIQLTNILRDVSEDAGTGRVYMPREWLAEAGLTGMPPAGLITSEAMPPLCRRLADEAASRFQLAARLLPDEDATRLRTARLMGAFYRQYLEQMRAPRWQWDGRRPHLSLTTCLRLVLAPNPK